MGGRSNMADERDDTPDDGTREKERNGDLASVFYVLGGIPFMIAFFLILFLLTGSCDQANISIHA